jgi:hypothetical protein
MYLGIHNDHVSVFDGTVISGPTMLPQARNIHTDSRVLVPQNETLQTNHLQQEDQHQKTALLLNWLNMHDKNQFTE